MSIQDPMKSVMLDWIIDWCLFPFIQISQRDNLEWCAQGKLKNQYLLKFAMKKLKKDLVRFCVFAFSDLEIVALLLEDLRWLN